MAASGATAELDKPWVMRTYSGHSTARASNELYRTNLAKGQTGLSIAFDLPTQIGYDPDAPEAAGEVGKVGVPVAHLGHMAPAARRHPGRDDEHVDDHQRHRRVAAGLYIANAEDRGVDPRAAGTTQNDIVKEYLSPGHVHLPARRQPPTDRRHDRLHRAPRPRSGTRSTCAATTCRRPGPPPCRSWPTPWPPPSACSTPSTTPARSRRTSCRRWSGGSASSSTPASASSRRPARCGRSPRCGTGSAPSATG